MRQQFCFPVSSIPANVDAEEGGKRPKALTIQRNEATLRDTRCTAVRRLGLSLHWDFRSQYQVRAAVAELCLVAQSASASVRRFSWPRSSRYSVQVAARVEVSSRRYPVVGRKVGVFNLSLASPLNILDSGGATTLVNSLAPVQKPTPVEVIVDGVNKLIMRRRSCARAVRALFNSVCAMGDGIKVFRNRLREVWFGNACTCPGLSASFQHSNAGVFVPLFTQGKSVQWSLPHGCSLTPVDILASTRPLDVSSGGLRVSFQTPEVSLRIVDGASLTYWVL
jgi:hypothetical protein